MLKRRLKEPFGKAGLVVAAIALVFAMLGGAYAAATNGGGKATASAKAKQGKQGKPGKTGPTGPAGAAGKDGSNGANGAAGEKGAQGIQGNPGVGTKGDTGEPGHGVVSTPSAGGPGEACEGSGGASYEIEESGVETPICNGEEGSPWTAGGTLPPGATETGSWGFTGTAADTNGILVPVSFPIQMPKNISDGHVYFEESGEEVEIEPGVFEFIESPFEKYCHGTASVPVAEAGEMCIYTAEGGGNSGIQNTAFDRSFNTGTTIGTSEPGELAAGRSGALLYFDAPTGNTFANGSFAVAGCTKVTEQEPNPPVPCP
jgi:Collagen triple helix repeat (20 copies)